MAMMAPLYVTGTNTAVGKTFLATLLLRRARERGLTMAALKPFCSGGREDAIQLHGMQTAGLTLDQVNPFHFPEPITPLLAARNAGKIIYAEAILEAVAHVLALSHPTLIEGAGGLLSPLAEMFNLRDLIQKIPGPVCVVAPNVLGAINSTLLTIEALSPIRPTIVLMSPREPDSSIASNAALIHEFSDVPVFEIPFLDSEPSQAVSDVIADLLGLATPL